MKPGASEEATDTREITNTPKPAFRPTIKPKEAGLTAERKNKAEASKPAFRPTTDFSISQSGDRPFFSPQHNAEGDYTPAMPANGKFTPAGYRAPKFTARPSFGVKLPAALIDPPLPAADQPQPESKQAESLSPEVPAASVQPADKLKPAFRPTMKPKR